MGLVPGRVNVGVVHRSVPPTVPPVPPISPAAFYAGWWFYLFPDQCILDCQSINQSAKNDNKKSNDKSIIEPLPGLPGGPGGPGGPEAPGGPDDPLSPGAPGTPLTPFRPRRPRSPRGPTGPGIPGSPIGPGRPSRPAGPTGPGAPAGHSKQAPEIGCGLDYESIQNVETEFTDGNRNQLGIVKG